MTLTNTCNTDAYFKTTLNVLDSSNTDNISKTKLAISGDRTINSLLISELMKAKLSNTPSNVVDTYLIDRGYLNVGETKTYDIRLWIDYEATSYTGSLDTKVIVDSYVKGQEPIYLRSNMAPNDVWKGKTENEFNYLAFFTLNTKKLPSVYSYNNETYTLTNTIDVSEQNNGEVLLGEYANSDKLIAVVGQEEGVIAPLHTHRLFGEHSRYVSNYEYIDLSNLDTSNVINMDSMFYNCTSLKTVKVDNFDTSKVEYMGAVFFSCISLENVNVSNFDTRNATTISAMFHNCQKIKNITISNNSTKLTTTGDMFSLCESLELVDLSDFNTESVSNMSNMFKGCTNLNKVIVGCNWIINDGANTTNMFTNSKITEVTKECNK